MDLSIKQKKILLRLARMTIENALSGIKDTGLAVDDEVLNKECGAFVTLHLKDELRGCIGNISAKKPLWQTIREMAKEAAFNDPRFYPLSKQELSETDIEISVLSPLKKIDSIEEIVVGTHGLFLVHGRYQGLLLPQVATEYQWGKIEFLDHTCSKAGLQKGCWQEEGCTIYIFSANVFNEKELQD
jgi:uncharacterized protein